MNAPEGIIKKRAQKVVDAGMNIPLAQLTESIHLNEKLDALLSKETTEKPSDEIQKISIEGASLVTIKGDRGDKGEKGDKGDRGIDGLNGKDGKDGVNGKNGLNGINGKDGLDGKDGVDGKDGKDGSPDTPEQIADKINTLDEEIKQSAIEGLSSLIKKIDNISNIPRGTGTKLLSQLNDTNIQSPTNGQVLKYDATTAKWYNGTGGAGSQDLQDVTDIGATTTNTITISPSGNNKALVANGSGSGIGIDITHSGSGAKLKIGTTGTGNLIDAGAFNVDNAGNVVGNNLSGTNTGDQLMYGTIAVAGQSDLDPSGTGDTLTFVAGTNITITTNAGTNELTINSSGSGLARSINSISSPTTAGATASTDYVYFVSGTTTITMPTAVGNTNRYTIKNTGSGVVTIATTSSQTIDGSTTHTLNVPYSVDLISDNTQWFIV